MSAHPAPAVTREIRFVANPTQRGFIVAKGGADLFACRMGEGKSAALAWCCWYHTRHNPGARWIFVRDTWESLRDTTQKEFFKWFPPGIMGTYHASSKTFRWNAQGMEGEVSFLGMDMPGDAAKLQSRELAGIAMDEPAPAAESGGIDEMIFDVALSRLRQPGMKWYACKLAENNPDETHWTHRRFVESPIKDFRVWQTHEPENTENLPEDYYERLGRVFSHRPDLRRRFVEGGFGFQQIGRQVTPEWSDALHRADALKPVRGVPLVLAWDFGLNPTAIISQVTPLGEWRVLHSAVGDGIGVEELIAAVVKPVLVQRFPRFSWRHTGDPAGMQREQSSSAVSAVRVLKRELGGAWTPGPVRFEERRDPLRAVLRQTRQGRGIVRVDKRFAKEVWQALRGGWHYPVSRTGVVGTRPVKDIHSHPADAMSYAASLLFPLGRLGRRRKAVEVGVASFFRKGLGFERPGVTLPRETARPGGRR